MLMILSLLTLISEERIFLCFKSRQSLLRAGRMLQRDTFLLLEPWCIQNFGMKKVRLKKCLLRINWIWLFTSIRVSDSLLKNFIRYTHYPQLTWAMSTWRITITLLYYWRTSYFLILIIICKLFIRSLDDDAAFTTYVLLGSTLFIHLIFVYINLIFLAMALVLVSLSVQFINAFIDLFLCISNCIHF